VAASHLDAESALLRHAREQLESGDAKGALDDTAAMASRFPRGELAQEREVVAIQALLALGQRAAAATRTTAFLRAHPSSPYADSLRQALKP
jgi:outer membrane protein assembly factor BamD (BamD/ComL family)